MILAVVILDSADSKAKMTLVIFDGLVWASTKWGASVLVIPIPTGLEIPIELTLWEFGHFLRRTCTILYPFVTIWLPTLWSRLTLVSWQSMRTTNTLFPHNSILFQEVGVSWYIMQKTKEKKKAPWLLYFLILIACTTLFPSIHILKYALASNHDKNDVYPILLETFWQSKHYEIRSYIM